ncbi:MAG TPA: hypothetical protein VIL00_03790 [Pseudonocardiaceae bacterium]
MPKTPDVNKARERATSVMETAVEQTRSPLLAVLSAGEAAAQAVAKSLRRARERVAERAENGRNGVEELHGESRPKLDPAELRKLVDAYTQAAMQLYGYLAERGEKALDRLRKNPQFQRTMEQLEAAAQNAQERVEHVRELADETLSKVAQRLRGAGEQAASTVEDTARETAETAERAGAKASDTVQEAGQKTAGATRNTTRRAGRATSRATDKDKGKGKGGDSRKSQD